MGGIARKPITIHMVRGVQAPRYDTGYETSLDRVTITEQGMVNRRPLLDFVFRDKHGEQVFFTLSSNEVLMIAATVRGINKRNHGVEE